MTPAVPDRSPMACKKFAQEMLHEWRNIGYEESLDTEGAFHTGVLSWPQGGDWPGGKRGAV